MISKFFRWSLGLLTDAYIRLLALPLYLKASLTLSVLGLAGVGIIVLLVNDVQMFVLGVLFIGFLVAVIGVELLALVVIPRKHKLFAAVIYCFTWIYIASIGFVPMLRGIFDIAAIPYLAIGAFKLVVGGIWFMSAKKTT